MNFKDAYVGVSEEGIVMIGAHLNSLKSFEVNTAH